MSLFSNTGSDSGLIKDGSDQAFMADVVEASRQQPVLVDFWAPWCGPCRTLGPALENQVRAAQGKIKLVKINIDENPGVAGQLGVRSIPAVFAFDQGRPVDGFMGALPESQVKQFIDRILGGAGGVAEDLDALIAQAEESLALQDIGGAAQAYAAALQLDPENPKGIAGLARCYLMGGDPAQAKAILDMAPPEKANDPAIQGVLAALQLAAEAPAGADVARLREQVATNPADHAARFDLAGVLAGQGDLDGAVDHLLAIIKADREWNEGAARKQVLKIFEAAGPTAEVTKSGRRKLSAVLFS
jgi:putative thioredoxin